MRRLGGYSLHLFGTCSLGCSKADTNQAQNQPAAAPQPAAQAQETQQPAAPQTAAQAQPPEAVLRRAWQARKRLRLVLRATCSGPPASAQTAVTPAGGSTEVKPVVPAAGATKQVSEATPVPVTTPTPPPPPLLLPPIVIASGTRLEVP